MSQDLSFGLRSRRDEYQSARRSAAVSIIMVLYLLLLFEGAARKWLLPDHELLLFFVRAPFGLLLYAMVFYYKLWPRTDRILGATYAFAFVLAVLGFVQMIVGEYDLRHLIIVGYGWMNYVFWIPLAFIIRDMFGHQEISRFFRITLYAALVSAVLVSLQAAAPMDSVINQGFIGSSGKSFEGLGSEDAMARPSGFFSSSLGQQLFACSVLAIVLGQWLQRDREVAVFEVPKLLLIAGTIAVVVMLVVSQSRGLFVNAALIFAAAVIASVAVGRSIVALRMIVGGVVLLVGGWFVWQTLFPSSLDAFIRRLVGADELEAVAFGVKFGLIGRIAHQFVSFFDYMSFVPLTGYLLGFGANAAYQIDWVRLPPEALTWSGLTGWSEEAWSKHIVELGPVVGVLFIVFRLWLSFAVARAAFLCASRGRVVMPVVLFGFVGTMLLLYQITAQGSVTGYAWLFLGVLLAIVRDANARANRAVSLGAVTAQFGDRLPIVRRY